MDDRIDVEIRNHPAHQSYVAGFALDEFGFLADEAANPGREIVEHDHSIATIEQAVGHVAADVSGAACHQNGHVKTLVSLSAAH